MKNSEEWMELAKLASVEQDPVKLLELTAKIDALLAEKQSRLEHRRIPSKPSE